MRLTDDIWLEGPYYIEFDHHGQLCIVGPDNHLHFGSTGLYRHELEVESVGLDKGRVVVRAIIKAANFHWLTPAIGHIRKVRDYIETPGEAKPTYEEVYRQHPDGLDPTDTKHEQTAAGYRVSYRRSFGRNWYGATVTFESSVKVEVTANGLDLSSDHGYIGLTIEADSSLRVRPEIKQVVGEAVPAVDMPGLDLIEHLLERSAAEIEHLVRYMKTSGFDYGTIFPRDWMEAAVLGKGDLSEEAIHYMFHKALEHVGPSGEGWHENIIGEYKSEKETELASISETARQLMESSPDAFDAIEEAIEQAKKLVIVRSMIDIEPLYILGMKFVDPKLWTADDRHRLQLVAGYVVAEADRNELITFKKKPAPRTKTPEYYGAGNWRDSELAYQHIHPVIAPFDVNAVFYPQALKLIAGNRELFGGDSTKAEKLLPKWLKIKERYRIDNRDGTYGYALALYDVKESGDAKVMAVNHIDEAYDHFYGDPSEKDTVNFCRRLMDPAWFYTKSGPILVGARDGYNTLGYHGTVIWTKQAGFVVGGLYRTYLRMKRDKTKPDTLRLLRQTIITTAAACIRAFIKLGAMPELHIDRNGEPMLYNEQPKAEGPMNQVQLWSAAGGRRVILILDEMMREYPAAKSELLKF